MHLATKRIRCPRGHVVAVRGYESSHQAKCMEPYSFVSTVVPLGHGIGIPVCTLSTGAKFGRHHVARYLRALRRHGIKRLVAHRPRGRIAELTSREAGAP